MPWSGLRNDELDRLGETKALAASLNLRTFLRLRRTEGELITVELPDIGITTAFNKKKLQSSLQLPLCSVESPSAPSEDVMNQLRRLADIPSDNTDTKCLAIISFLYLFSSITPKNGELPSISLLLSSKLPTSAGLGSSAAYSTSLAAALLELAGIVSVNPGGEYSQDDLTIINDWAFQSEKVIHGKPSGIDNSVSTYGGVLCFQAGKITPLTRVPTLRILLTNTKVPRSTKVLVAGVKEKFDKYPRIIGPVIDSIDAISEKCEEVFREMDHTTSDQHYQILKELVKINQSHLSVLGVSHSSLDNICRITSQRGLETKLTGAGGGGCAFTLLPPGTDDSVIMDTTQALEAEGYSYWQTVIGGTGISRHDTLKAELSPPQIFSQT